MFVEYSQFGCCTSKTAEEERGREDGKEEETTTSYIHPNMSMYIEREEDREREK